MQVQRVSIIFNEGLEDERKFGAAIPEIAEKESVTEAIRLCRNTLDFIETGVTKL